MTTPLRLVAVLLGAAWMVPAAAQAQGAATNEVVHHAGQATVRAVYHFDAGLEQARRGLRNIRNHLNADPSAQITVVGLADGIDFMLEGAKTEGGYPFSLLIEELQAEGVRFKACNNTLEARQIPPDRVVDGIEIVASGVAELARLQAQERYAYLKP